MTIFDSITSIRRLWRHCRHNCNKKVDCGKAHFEALGVNFREASTIHEVLKAQENKVANHKVTEYLILTQNSLREHDHDHARSQSSDQSQALLHQPSVLPLHQIVPQVVSI